METYYIVGLIIICLSIVFCFYIYKLPVYKKEQKEQVYKEQMTIKIDEQKIIREMTEEQALEYYNNSIYNEHEPDHEGQSAKEFLMSRCTEYWS